MEMKDMKVSKAEREARYKDIEKSDGGSEYPYGLNVHLDDEAMEKLSLDTMPAVGTKVLVMAEAEVMSCSVSDSGLGARKSMGIQIQKLAIELPAEKKKSTEETLYKA